MNWEMEEVDVEQGSDQWHELRRGIPTASVFKALMAKGERKGRATLLYRLAGERITGVPAETFKNDAMERGNTVEPLIRKDYGFKDGRVLRPIGFIRAKRKDGYVICGASPDSLVDDDGVLEIKSTKPELLIPLWEEQQAGKGIAPTEHYAQCQGVMALSGRQWCDLRIGYPGMKSVEYRVPRSQNYIDDLTKEIEVFDLELRRLVERLK